MLRHLACDLEAMIFLEIHFTAVVTGIFLLEFKTRELDELN